MASRSYSLRTNADNMPQEIQQIYSSLNSSVKPNRYGCTGYYSISSSWSPPHSLAQQATAVLNLLIPNFYSVLTMFSRLSSAVIFVFLMFSVFAAATTTVTVVRVFCPHIN
jgi:hypothetical protein